MIPEARLLFPEHYEELALNKDAIKLECDEAKYEYGEQQNVLHVVTARDEGKLVGYYFGILMTHLHYKSAGWMCYTDAYYLQPKYRKGYNGVAFLKFIMRSLKERGAIKLYISTKAHQDHGPLFERLGMKFSDKLYTRML